MFFLAPPGQTPRRHKYLPLLFLGVDADKRLVHVATLPQGGKTDLRCPYCEDLLTAKMGEILIHHFAHSVGSGCAALKKRGPRIRLPLFDSFDCWDIPPKAYKALLDYQNGEWYRERDRLLHDYDFRVWNEWKGRGGDYELTKRAKVLLGELSLKLFAEIQEPLLWKTLCDRLREAHYGGDEEKVDASLFQAQMRHVYLSPLCLVRVGEDEYVISTAPSGDVVRQLPHRAHLLFYFRYRYREFQHPTKPEVFQIPREELGRVTGDLSRVPKRVLTTEELNLLGEA
jgi:hypothetical protein